MARKKTQKQTNGDHFPDNATERPLDNASQIVSVDEKGLRDILLNLRSGEKYIADLAQKFQVSPQMLGEVLSGSKGFGPKLLKAMGVVRSYKMYDVEIIMGDPEDEPIS